MTPDEKARIFTSLIYYFGDKLPCAGFFRNHNVSSPNLSVVCQETPNCLNCHHGVRVAGKEAMVCLAFLEIRQSMVASACLEFEARDKVVSNVNLGEV